MLRLGTPQVSALNAGTGSTENGIEVFEVLVQTLIKFYGVGWGSQQREIAEYMFSKYYWLHMAEVRQFSLKAKAGEFDKKYTTALRSTEGEYLGSEEWDGKIYGQLTPAVLMKWMDRFAAESTHERAGIDWDRKPLPPLTEEEKAGLVKTETVEAALNEFMNDFGVLPASGDIAAKEEIYRQEKIKQRQRDVMARKKLDEELKENLDQ